MNYSYHYSQKDAAKFEKFLSELEVNFVGQRTPWGIRGGAIDLVTVFEVAVEWGPWALAAKVISGKYLDGLLNTDAFKDVGTNHRRKLIALSQKAADEIRNLSQKLSVMAGNGLNGFFRNDELAVTLILPIENLSCYVVLNQDGVDSQALEILPEAVDRVLELKTCGAIPGEAHASQLFYDLNTLSWRYLFVPTNEGFGNYIDRCINLENGETFVIKSSSEFIERFQPSQKDRLKFLVSPFRNDILPPN